MCSADLDPFSAGGRKGEPSAAHKEPEMGGGVEKTPSAATTGLLQTLGTLVSRPWRQNGKDFSKKVYPALSTHLYGNTLSQVYFFGGRGRSHIFRADLQLNM